MEKINRCAPPVFVNSRRSLRWGDQIYITEHAECRSRALLCVVETILGGNSPQNLKKQLRKSRETKCSREYTGADLWDSFNWTCPPK